MLGLATKGDASVKLNAAADKHTNYIHVLK
jgi:hypothetical protein